MTENHHAPAASEGQIISLLRKRFSARAAGLEVGIGDDAAVLEAAGVRQAVTTDLLVEGVHFHRRYMSLADIGYKALAVNVSDIAAMGGNPRFAFGVLGVPPGTAGTAISELLDGVAACASEYGVALAGGDTVAAPQCTVGFTVIGELPSPPLLRSGARPGDVLWHSGSLGLSQCGLHLLWGGMPAATALSAAHLRPAAQVPLGRFLSERGLATACIDLSDSLSQCLLQLADASGVGLALDFTGYVIAPEVEEFARQHHDSGGAIMIPAALDPGGKALRYVSCAEYLLASAEDYQLLFTAPPAATAELLRDSPTTLKQLGVVAEPAAGCTYRGERGDLNVLAATGFTHLD